jgi:hypothetical protein
MKLSIQDLKELKKLFKNKRRKSTFRKAGGKIGEREGRAPAKNKIYQTPTAPSSREFLNAKNIPNNSAWGSHSTNLQTDLMTEQLNQLKNNNLNQNSINPNLNRLLTYNQNIYNAIGNLYDDQQSNNNKQPFIYEPPDEEVNFQSYKHHDVGIDSSILTENNTPFIDYNTDYNPDFEFGNIFSPKDKVDNKTTNYFTPNPIKQRNDLANEWEKYLEDNPEDIAKSLNEPEPEPEKSKVFLPTRLYQRQKELDLYLMEGGKEPEVLRTQLKKTIQQGRIDNLKEQLNDKLSSSTYDEMIKEVKKFRSLDEKIKVLKSYYMKYN